ncbi:hypothetical protein HK096_005099, partial [Nowakowskiella sp. JEL0078]
MDVGLNFWENFIESIAQVMSRALTDDESERLLSSFQSFHARLRQLSSDNLRQLALEAPVKRPFCKHKGTCTHNAIRGFLQTFAIAYATKYALSFFPALIMGKIYRNPSILLKMTGKDTTTFALFLSGFISSYKSVICLLRRARGKSDNDGFNSLVAGTVAGLALMLDQNNSRRVMIALYLSTRNMHFVCRWFWRKYLEKLFGAHFLDDGGFQSTESSLCPSPIDARASPSSSIRDLGMPLDRRQNQQFSGNILESQIQDSDENSLDQSYQILSPSPLSPTSSQRILHDSKKAESYRFFLRQLAGTIVMMLSSSQILYSFIAAPDTLAKSYLSFLLTHGNMRTLHPKNPRLWLEAMKTVVNAAPSALSTKFLTLAEESQNIAPPLFSSSIPNDIPADLLIKLSDELQRSPHEYILCAFQHPHTSDCTHGSLTFFLNEIPRALALYGPLNAIMYLVFKGKNVLLNPLKNFKSYLKGTLRSVLFLCSYTTLAWTLPCTFRNWVGKDQTWMYVLNGAAAGLTLLIEVPGRRLELGINGEVIYFCASTGIMMTLYQLDPESIHDGYRKIMIRFLG